MTDGQPDIVGPIGSLVGLGIMAYGAKTLIDVMRDKSVTQQPKKQYTQQPKKVYTEQSDDRVTRGLNKMLGR